MSSSKIIKARSGSEYRCFDFRDISDSTCKLPGNQGSRPKTGSGGGSDLPDHGEQALQRLQEELQERILETDQRAQEVEQEAHAQGFEKGRQQGAEAVLAVAKRLDGLFDELDRVRTNVFRDYRNWLISSSLEIARYVIQRELRAQPELLLETMESALDQATDQHALVFILHPDDLKLLRKQVDLSRLEQPGKSISLKADESMARGGCRLESDVQLVDCSLETRLKLVEEEIKRKKARIEGASVETKQ